jgi:polysaccharide biosynthesis protein PslH
MALRALMVAPAMPARSGNGLAMRLSLFLEALQSIAHTDLILIPLLGDTAKLMQGDTQILRAPLQPDTELSLLLRLRDPQQRLQSFVRYGKTTFAGHFSNTAWADLAHNVSSKRYDIVHIARSHLAPALSHFRGQSVTTLDLDEDDLASFTSLARLEQKQRKAFQAAWHEQREQSILPLSRARLKFIVFPAATRDFALNALRTQSPCRDRT